jgi:hypothetical protein
MVENLSIFKALAVILAVTKCRGYGVLRQVVEQRQLFPYPMESGTSILQPNTANDTHSYSLPILINPLIKSITIPLGKRGESGKKEGDHYLLSP